MGLQGHRNFREIMGIFILSVRFLESPLDQESPLSKALLEGGSPIPVLR